MKIKDVQSLIDRVSDRVPDSGDDLLDMLGLQRRSSVAAMILPAVGTLFVGAVAGAFIGMFFGPRYGYKLMDRIGVRVPERVREGVQKTSEGRFASNNNNNNNTSGSVAPRGTLRDEIVGS